MAPHAIQAVNLDANEALFFTRQLEYIKSQSYDIKYPDLKAQQLIPISSEAGEGAQTIVYYTYDRTGMFKIISNYADDLPRAEVKGTEVITKIKTIGGSFAYNYEEIQAAMFAGLPLQARKAAAARLAYEQAVNRIAWLGDIENNVVGVLYHPNVTKYSAAATGTGSSRLWKDKTPTQLIADVNAWINDIITLTKGVETPNTVLLPIKQYTQLATTPYSALDNSGAVQSVSNMTVLGFLKQAHPEITVWDFVPDFTGLKTKPSDGTTSTVDVAMVFKRDPNNLTLEIPLPFKQLNTQERGLEYITPCLARIAGVIVYYPLSISIIDSI